MRLSIHLKNSLSYLTIILLYGLIVLPTAFDPSIGDFQAYKDTFDQISRREVSDFSGFHIVSDDLIFYFALKFLTGSSDYYFILSCIAIVNSLLFLNLVRVGALKIRQPAVAIAVALAVSLNPKIFEMLFFNVRQGLGFLIVVYGLYFLSNRALRLTALIASVLAHFSNFLFVLIFMGTRITSAIRRSRMLSMLECVAALGALYLATQFLDRFSYTWSHEFAYTLVVLVLTFVMILSVVLSRGGVRFEREVMLVGTLVLSGVMMGLPTERLVGPMLLFYSLYLGSKQYLTKVDVLALIPFIGYTMVALGFWIY